MINNYIKKIYNSKIQIYKYCIYMIMISSELKNKNNINKIIL